MSINQDNKINTKEETFSLLSNEYQLLKAMNEDVTRKNQTSIDEVKNLLSISMALNKNLVNFIKNYRYA